jgi:hypothetical protein
VQKIKIQKTKVFECRRGRLQVKKGAICRAKMLIMALFKIYSVKRVVDICRTS